VFNVSKPRRHSEIDDRRTIFGVIRSGYVFRYNSFRRKRIYRAQKAREAETWERVERAVWKAGQMMGVTGGG
jgi:hypothetical protein